MVFQKNLSLVDICYISTSMTEKSASSRKCFRIFGLSFIYRAISKNIFSLLQR